MNKPEPSISEETELRHLVNNFIKALASLHPHHKLRVLDAVRAFVGGYEREVSDA